MYNKNKINSTEHSSRRNVETENNEKIPLQLHSLTF